MNNWCIGWFFTHILLGILIFKGLTARRHYKSFGVKGLLQTPKQNVSKSEKNFPPCAVPYIYNFILWWTTTIANTLP
jgi:hypothetical protein